MTEYVLFLVWGLGDNGYHPTAQPWKLKYTKSLEEYEQLSCTDVEWGVKALGKEWQNFTRCPLFLKSNHSCGVTAIKTLQRLIQKWKLNNIQLFCILCHPSPIPILFHIQSSRFKFKSQLSVRRRWVKKVASYSYQDMWPMGDSFCADTYPGANFRS